LDFILDVGSALGTSGYITDLVVNCAEIIGEVLPFFLLAKSHKMRQRCLLNPKFRKRLAGVHNLDPSLKAERSLGGTDLLLFKQFLKFKKECEDQKEQEAYSRGASKIEVEPNSATSTRSAGFVSVTGGNTPVENKINSLVPKGQPGWFRQ